MMQVNTQFGNFAPIDGNFAPIDGNFTLNDGMFAQTNV